MTKKLIVGEAALVAALKDAVQTAKECMSHIMHGHWAVVASEIKCSWIG